MIRRSSTLARLERKIGFLAIPNLMLILVGAMAIVFLMDRMLLPITGVSLHATLAFDRAAILDGQIWRVFTFLFLPPASGLLWTALSLYLCYKLYRSVGYRIDAGFIAIVTGAIADGFILTC